MWQPNYNRRKMIMKNVISKSIPIKILLSVIVLALLAFYLKIFFTTGAYFEDTFLKKETSHSQIQYIGSNKYGDIKITVKELSSSPKSVEVIYELPNNIKKEYTINFKNDSIDNNDSLLTIENIKDEAGNLVFTGGYYDKDSQILLDENKNPVFEGYLNPVVEGQNPFIANYKVSISTTTDFATSTVDSRKGNFYILLIALIILTIILIDIKFPLFFFTLRYMWTVEKPEPSDFYTFMQRICWYVCPVISIILMIVAII